jgi:hypothetical protein
MMTTNRQCERDEGLRRDMRDTLNDLISQQVLHSLGTPDDLFRVQVSPVGDDRYRVNVLVGTAATSARVAESFFLTVDGDGTILTSSPKMVRLY